MITKKKQIKLNLFFQEWKLNFLLKCINLKKLLKKEINLEFKKEIERKQR